MGQRIGARCAAEASLPWADAWQDALYGEAGFFVRGERGARHDFSTSVTTGPRLAQALAVLLLRLLDQLGMPDTFDVVDVGAGDGRLLADLMAAVPSEVAARARVTAVEVGPHPENLDPAISWCAKQPSPITGLLIAHEWLDNVPCPVVEVDSDGTRRLVETDQHGRETLGATADHHDTVWLDRWWPITEPGERAEVGRPRDTAWQAITTQLTHGLAVAVDYTHTAGNRPARGSLTGYRLGRQVQPVPDGSTDITAHVALDSCAVAGDRLMTQRAALLALGVTGRADPDGGLAALRHTGQERALLDPHGAGSFGWLLHPVGPVDVDRLVR